MGILAYDNKWRVSVEGQLDYPFDTELEARHFAENLTKEGFDTFVYHSKSKTEQKDGAE